MDPEPAVIYITTATTTTTSKPFSQESWGRLAITLDSNYITKTI
jgi:hypothetical protein